MKYLWLVVALAGMVAGQAKPAKKAASPVTACTGCVTLKAPLTSTSTLAGNIILNPSPGPYWWTATNADGTVAVRCVFGQSGKPGECSDKTQKVPFPVSCDAPKDGYFTNCRIVRLEQ